MSLLESLEDKNMISSKELDKALDKLNKRYADVAEHFDITASSVHQWVHVAKNIPKNRRKDLLKLLIKWKEQAEESELKPENDKIHTETEINQQSEDMEKEVEETEKADTTTNDKSQVRLRRESLGVTQRFIGGCINMAPSTYARKENCGLDEFTDKEASDLIKVFNSLRDMKSGKLVVENKNMSDIKFALGMLEKHLDHMPEGIVKNMALQYIDLISQKLK